MAIISLESIVWSSRFYWLWVYSLVVRGPYNETKNLASLYVGVPMADKIGQKDGKPSVTNLWNMLDFRS